MNEIKIKQTTWNLKPLFKNDNDPAMAKKRKIIKKESYKFINKWKKRKDYLQNPIALKKALDEYENWERYFEDGGDEWYYFWLRTRQDQNNATLKAKFNQIDDFANKIQNNIQFFELNIARIPEKLQRKFLQYKKLKEYKHFIERLFAQSKHLLSDPEEKILNLKASTSHSNWVKMVSGFLSKEERRVLSETGKEETKNFSEILALLDNANRKIGNSAAKAFNDILSKNIDAAEQEINSILQNKKIDDEIRKMPRPDSARHIGDDIESEIVDKLIDAVSKRFDIPKKYYELKAKMLGVKKLRYHERNAPYGKIGKKYSYQKAIGVIYEVFKNLDDKFAEIFINFVQSGQIDVYPKKGKYSNAFCAHKLISQPIYVGLNYTEELDDVRVIAHEFGHAINSQLIKEKQNSLNLDTPLSAAEVASAFMEDFAFDGIIKKADEELKLTLMMRKLNNDISAIFRQIACYNFENELHQNFRNKGYLSKEEIGILFQKHMKSYMGNYVEYSPGSENWWVYWEHIRSFFYNYSYANGLLIAKSLQSEVKKKPEFIKKIKNFLSAGTSDSPKNILKKLGMDITKKEFWNKGIGETEKLLYEAERLAKKLGKI